MNVKVIEVGPVNKKPSLEDYARAVVEAINDQTAKHDNRTTKFDFCNGSVEIIRDDHANILQLSVNGDIKSFHINEAKDKVEMNFIQDQYKYDDNGNLIYAKRMSGLEIWYDYDSNGKCIHARGSNGAEEWYDDDVIVQSKTADGEYSDKRVF